MVICKDKHCVEGYHIRTIISVRFPSSLVPPCFWLGSELMYIPIRFWVDFATRDGEAKRQITAFQEEVSLSTFPARIMQERSSSGLAMPWQQTITPLFPSWRLHVVILSQGQKKVMPGIAKSLKIIPSEGKL